MADLIYITNTSLDGYIVDANGNFNWSEPTDEVHTFFNEFQKSVGTALYGRRLYATMRVWETFALDELPPVQRDFAEAWRDTDKIVYSSTLESVPEPRTSLERTFEPEAIRAMKQNADRDLAIGGAELAGAAIQAGLVDRYMLRLVPVVVGGGTRALPDGTWVDLSLEETRGFDDGSVLIDYRVRDAGES